jgi:AraC-like DNA-binding protein
MESDRIGGEPYVVSVDTSDLDEAREVLGEHLYPRALKWVGRPARVAARIAFLRTGGLTLADMQYGAQLAGKTGELGTYHFYLPLAGTFAAGQGGRLITGDISRGGIYRPVGDVVLHHMSADFHVLAVSVDPAALEGQLVGMLDAPVRGPLRLGEHLDVREAPGRGCAELIRLFGNEMDNPTGLLTQPIVAAPLEETLLTSLLFAVDHQYRDALGPGPPRCPGYRVARAVEAIQAEPQHPYTIAALAQIADVNVRALRQEFRRQVGMSPMAYLRDVRMARAHAELVDADPDRTSVADVARRWGFPRITGFSARYRARYRVAPLQTLRGMRGRRDG